MLRMTSQKQMELYLKGGDIMNCFFCGETIKDTDFTTVAQVWLLAGGYGKIPDCAIIHVECDKKQMTILDKKRKIMFKRLKRFCEMGYRETIPSSDTIYRLFAELMKDIQFKTMVHNNTVILPGTEIENNVPVQKKETSFETAQRYVEVIKKHDGNICAAARELNTYTKKIYRLLKLLPQEVQAELSTLRNG